MNRKTPFFALFFLIAAFVFADNEISQYTQDKAYEFQTLKVSLKSADDDEALEIIEQFRTETLQGMQDVAVDLEQEQRIIESMCFMEKYEHLIQPEKRDELRKPMKEHMNANVKLLNSRKDEEISKWFYLVCGDVAAYYITRSITATLRYGFKLKGWYEKALEKDSGMTCSNVSLGNWYFYAPFPFGSSKKAEKCYKNGIEGAYADGERYLAYEFLSQLYFEQKKTAQCEEYLQKAYDLNLGTKELDKIRLCNKNKYSLFQYNRNRAGIDEKIPDSELQEEDK